MEKEKTTGRGTQNEYLRVLLGQTQRDLRCALDRLRDWRRRRGEILYLTRMAEEEGKAIQGEIGELWQKYRAVKKFDGMLKE